MTGGRDIDANFHSSSKVTLRVRCHEVDSLSCGVVDELGWRVKCVSDEDAFERLVFKFVRVRLVNLCIGWTSEGPEVGEIQHLIRNQKQGNAIGSSWPCSVADMDHGHEGVTS